MTGEADPAKADKSGHSAADGGGADVSAYAGLSPRQGRAMEALLQGQTVLKAADAAGVNERTLRRWLEKPRFRSALQSARRETFGQAVGLTARYAPVAVGTLVKVMNDMMASPSARVTAAAVMLKFGREGIEMDDLAARLDALEREAKPTPSNTPVDGRPRLRLASTEEGS